MTKQDQFNNLLLDYFLEETVISYDVGYLYEKAKRIIKKGLTFHNDEFTREFQDLELDFDN